MVLDLGRLPEARFVSGDAPLSEQEVDADDLQGVIDRLGEFGDDNRGRHRAYPASHIGHPQPPRAHHRADLPRRAGRLRHHQDD